MKRMIITALAAALAVQVGAVDFESFSFNDRLLSMPGPSAPVLFEDSVIFTASSSSRRVGIAFAHEGFGRVHWFKKLMKTVDEPEQLLEKDAKTPKKKASPFVDSGLLFYAFEYPRGMRELEYRLVVDGLWTPDPRNPVRRIDPSTGVVRSVVKLPEPSASISTYEAPPGSLRFSYDTAPGETVTVAGSFNGWDPFMYELIEERPGHYVLTLPLPPGVHRYVFFHRGERILDPNNPKKVYAVDGKVASEAVLE
jgi:hypothetical protein